MRIYRCPRHPDLKVFDASAREYHDWKVNNVGDFIEDCGPTDSEVMSVSCPECGEQLPAVEMSKEEVKIIRLKGAISDLLGNGDLEIVEAIDPQYVKYKCRYCGREYEDDLAAGQTLPLKYCTADDCPACIARKELKHG